MKSRSHFYVHLALIVWVTVAVTGCAKLKYMRQLLTLKAVSEDGDAQVKQVEAGDARFDTLLKAAGQDDFLVLYPNQPAVTQAFGDPIFAKTVTRDGRAYQRWMYRYPTRLTKSPKIYLYFDQEKHLSHYDVVAEK